MLEQPSLVTKTAPGRVWIKSRQVSACSGCGQQASCGTATLASLLPKREFCLECDLDLEVGDQVLVAINDAQLLAVSALVYMLPLLFMLLVTGLASSLLPSALADIWLPLIALLSLLSVFLIIRRLQDVLLWYFCFKPQILRKL